jgi:hypothetical protein
LNAEEFSVELAHLTGAVSTARGTHAAWLTQTTIESAIEDIESRHKILKLYQRPVR